MNTRLILENLPAPVVAFDIETNEILFANSGFALLIDLPKKDIVGKKADFLDSFITDEKGQSIIKRIFSFGEMEGEIVDIRSGNAIKNLVCQYRIIIQDTLVIAICLFEQIQSLDDTINTENSLLTLKQESHKIRSLLNSIMGLSEVISDESEPQKIRAAAENILDAGKSILELFEKREQIHEAEVKEEISHSDLLDIIPVIKECIQEFVPLIKDKKIHLRFTTFQKIVLLKADKTLFGDSFRIFLEHGIKGSDSGDVVVEVFERYSDTHKAAIIRITNSGMGIKKSYLDMLAGFSTLSEIEQISDSDKVYADFSRAKLILEQINGKMSVESQYGVGTAISLTFPLPVQTEIKSISVIELPTVERIARIDHGVEFNPEILLVDDDQIVYKIVKRYLEKRGNLEYAIDGRRALLAAVNRHFDIIFLDINLGIGLTGLQVAKKLRKMGEYFNTPIVAITAYALPGDKERALAAGCTFYQSKPFTRADIIAVYNQCLSLIELNMRR